MALDRDYFNSIDLKPVKKKYYSLEEVDALLVDIRAKALAANEETEKLKDALAESEKKRIEAGDAVVEILANIKKPVGPDLSEVLSGVGEAIANLKKVNEKAINEMNIQWQKFLSGIIDEAEPADLKTKVGSIAKDMEEIEK